jgi:hypothetical protein
LLHVKEEYIRKRKTRSGAFPTVSYFSLVDKFNTVSGLKDGKETYVSKFISAALSSAVRMYNRGFPSGWKHSVKANNGIKGDTALLYLLGWVEKVPSSHKLAEVLFNTVDEDSTLVDGKLVKKYTLVNITQDKRFFLQPEFRAAVCLTLPKLLTALPSSHEEQYRREGLQVKSTTIISNYVKGGRDLVVDALNDSYGLKVSLKNPKSKTRALHYKIGRDRLINITANRPLLDGSGKVFKTFSELPPATQKFLRDKFRYPAKKLGPSQSVQEPEEMITDEGVEPPHNTSAPKKRKMTKGEAKVATRKSGRLAAQKSKS